MKRRADGRWLKTITHKGKRLYFYSSKKTESQAVKDINRQIMEYKQQEAEGHTKGMLFSAVAEAWERQHYETVAFGTYRSYKPACADCIDYFGDYDIRDITPQMVSAFILRQSTRGYAAKTVKTRLLVLNLIFKYAIISQYITSNPCQYISVPKGLKKTKREMPSEEDIRIVKNSVDIKFGFFAYFILYTGLRRGEALALRYEDIDFDAKIIHVRRSVYWMGNAPHLKEPKTEAGKRDVFLLDTLLPYLDRSGTGYVFADTDGELMRNSRAQDAWEAYTKATGLTITPHQLRHAYASVLFDAGLDAKDAQELMGHANISVTRDIYTQISKSHKLKAQEKLNAFINQN